MEESLDGAAVGEVEVGLCFGAGQVDDAPSQTPADIHVIDPIARVLGHKLKP